MAEQEYDAQLIRDISTQKTYQGNTVRSLYGVVKYSGQTIRNVIAATVVKYSGMLVRNIMKRYPTKYDDWYLPSRGDLVLVRDNLKSQGLGGISGRYWSSSESSATNGWGIDMDTGGHLGNWKTATEKIRMARHFVTREVLSIGSIGPAGGYIFNEVVIGNLRTYYEFGTTETFGIWSNVANVAIGNTSTLAGQGHDNSIKIVSQSGHVNSAAKYCLDYVLPVRLYQTVRKTSRLVSYVGQTVRNITDTVTAFYRATLVRRITREVKYTGQGVRKITELAKYVGQTRRFIRSRLKRVYQTVRNIVTLDILGDMKAKMYEDKYDAEWHE